MAENIRKGDYNDFGKLLHLCAYVPKGVFCEAENSDMKRKTSFRNPLLHFFMRFILMKREKEPVFEPMLPFA